ncbi:unnamed protein product [Amaranthus hypochondriacus]
MAENSAISENRQDFGKLQYGCVHYKRRCRIRAPCCNQVFSCRHCHNEATSLSNPNEEHELVRSEITHVICAVCDTEQPVGKVCSSCGVNMGEYFCEICKFYDDESQKKHFHCNECGVCRVGGREKYFHCSKCGCCCSTAMRDNHECVQDILKMFCPICYDYLFESIKILRRMGCGHIIHRECFDDMLNKKQYRCPICCKAVVDMSLYWVILDEEIGATTMPAEYQYEVLILCNDCSRTSRVNYHIFGQKCSHCHSYNTCIMQKFDIQPETPSDS